MEGMIPALFLEKPLIRDMFEGKTLLLCEKERRFYGVHFTPLQVFESFILSEIRDKVYDYIWVDLFAGEGNLILPILELIPREERPRFFYRHIFLFDINDKIVEKAREKAVKYGIPKELVEKNIQVRDTMLNYPEFILRQELPVYHITNPPYLYIGYIQKHAKELLKYFRGDNEGYQDLYQIALANDMRHGIERMIYVIPANFLFGFSVSNKIRLDLLKYYRIRKAVVLEKRVFEYTGTNVVIVFFERKGIPRHELQYFKGLKIGSRGVIEKDYILKPENKYRAGTEFEEFVSNYKAGRPLQIKYYLLIDEVERNRGDYCLDVINANKYTGQGYEKTRICVNKELYHKIKENILFVRTLDTGSYRGRAGLYVIREEFGVDGILTLKPYRTHPIQLFFEPRISIRDQILLKEYFNTLLEYFREVTDSEFMTTYKYSDSEYTRKYLGLKQVRALIETFPILVLRDGERGKLEKMIHDRNAEAIIDFVKRINRKYHTLDKWLYRNKDR